MIIPEIKRGVVRENPLLALGLGLCPALAVSTSLQKGVGLGCATMLVLVVCNGVLAVLKKTISPQIRIPVAVMVIAATVTVVDMLIKSFMPSLSDSLGIYVPLIAVNCIVLARCESVAFAQPVRKALLDGIVCGLGYLGALMVLSGAREILGSHTLWGLRVYPGASLVPAAALPFGGLMALAIILGLMRRLNPAHGGK
ncbi:MAG: Rnf-Nqr domain containing protein [Chitinivibrionales bacterium]|nr:Rnf-Nqr domain containing protein [Chitinivibrionales bacterium]